MKTIQLKSRPPKNLRILVDDENYNYLSKFNWYFNKGYAIRVTPKNQGAKIIKMHREILGATDSKKLVDHIDRNKLNNQRNNLRYVNSSTNSINSGIYKNNTSGCKNVYWHKNRKAWQVFTQRNRKIIYIGLFKNKNDAIKARQSFIG